MNHNISYNAWHKTAGKYVNPERAYSRRAFARGCLTRPSIQSDPRVPAVPLEYLELTCASGRRGNFASLRQNEMKAGTENKPSVWSQRSAVAPSKPTPFDLPLMSDPGYPCTLVSDQGGWSRPFFVPTKNLGSLTTLWTNHAHR